MEAQGKRDGLPWPLNGCWCLHGKATTYSSRPRQRAVNRPPHPLLTSCQPPHSLVATDLLSRCSALVFAITFSLFSSLPSIHLPHSHSLCHSSICASNPQHFKPSLYSFIPTQSPKSVLEIDIKDEHSWENVREVGKKFVCGFFSVSGFEPSNLWISGHL